MRFSSKKLRSHQIKVRVFPVSFYSWETYRMHPIVFSKNFLHYIRSFIKVQPDSSFFKKKCVKLKLRMPSTSTISTCTSNNKEFVTNIQFVTDCFRIRVEYRHSTAYIKTSKYTAKHMQVEWRRDPMHKIYICRELTTMWHMGRFMSRVWFTARPINKNTFYVHWNCYSIVLSSWW